ncbi:nickel/cobalt transporter [Bradyrhizobium sp. 2TAF24]|uniref:nickel/cobalt transporter n=1 Tax=Bradyrhizobium sp. 2TAF24 TaxID=3233011 RepID=UPI003F93045C
MIAAGPRGPLVETRLAVALLAVVAAVLWGDGLLHAALAQSPFGVGRPGSSDPQVGGLVGWLLDKQSQFYRQMSATIRAAKSDGSAVWTLLGISFAYGIFHAAGPGHGKAVISSYLVANEETARRGIVLAFAAALLQALVAIIVVGIGAWLLNATARTMCGAERVIEIASYALIAVFGARLVWTKGGGLLRALRGARRPLTAAVPLVPALAGASDAAAASSHAHARVQDQGNDHPGHGHHRHDHGHAGPAHGEPGHVHDEHCGHNHGPTPDQLAGPGGWRRGLSAIFAVGLRPCSGAILVLVFALAQGMLWAGVAATLLMGLGTAITVAAIAILAVSAKGLARRLSAGRVGGGALILRGVEFGAAALVLLLGVGLLLGYVVAERVTCF